MFLKHFYLNVRKCCNLVFECKNFNTIGSISRWSVFWRLGSDVSVKCRIVGHIQLRKFWLVKWTFVNNIGCFYFRKNLSLPPYRQAMFHEVIGWHIFGPELWNSAPDSWWKYTMCMHPKAGRNIQPFNELILIISLSRKCQCN